jgi:hypothetical protein
MLERRIEGRKRFSPRREGLKQEVIDSGLKHQQKRLARGERSPHHRAPTARNRNQLRARKRPTVRSFDRCANSPRGSIGRSACLVNFADSSLIIAPQMRLLGAFGVEHRRLHQAAV